MGQIRNNRRRRSGLHVPSVAPARTSSSITDSATRTLHRRTAWVAIVTLTVVSAGLIWAQFWGHEAYASRPTAEVSAPHVGNTSAWGEVRVPKLPLTGTCGLFRVHRGFTNAGLPRPVESDEECLMPRENTTAVAHQVEGILAGSSILVVAAMVVGVVGVRSRWRYFLAFLAFGVAVVAMVWTWNMHYDFWASTTGTGVRTNDNVLRTTVFNTSLGLVVGGLVTTMSRRLRGACEWAAVMLLGRRA